MKYVLVAYALFFIIFGFFAWMIALLCLAEWLGLTYIGIPISEERSPYLAVPGMAIYLIGATWLLARIFNWARPQEETL